MIKTLSSNEIKLWHMESISMSEKCVYKPNTTIFGEFSGKKINF